MYECSFIYSVFEIVLQLRDKKEFIDVRSSHNYTRFEFFSKLFILNMLLVRCNFIEKEYCKIDLQYVSFFL